MPLTNNDMKILIQLLENRLNAGWDPDVADLLERMKKEKEKYR